MVARAAGTDYGLGTPLAELGPAKKHRRSNTIAHGLLVATGLALVIGGIALALGEGDGQPLGAIFVPCGLGFLAWGAWGLATLARDASWRVVLCADGFAQTRRGRTDLFRWDEIEAIYRAVTERYVNGIYAGTTHIFTIRRADGLEVKLTDALDRVGQLGQRIEEGTRARQFPRALAAVRGGGMVPFGALTVGPAGLGNGKETLPWGAIGGVRLERGMISINRDGTWRFWGGSVAKTPNISVFLALVEAMIGGGRRP